VAAALESLAGLVPEPQKPRARSPDREAIKRARTCYDHLAGELAVALADKLFEHGLLCAGEGKRLIVTPAGKKWFVNKLGIDLAKLKPGRLGLACNCLDWTERRFHIAGPLGVSILRRFCQLGLVSRSRSSRAVILTKKGKRFFCLELKCPLGRGFR
jgi:hypothetical protein